MFGDRLITKGRVHATIMLHESPRRNDPVTPMTNSNLVEVLQEQSQVKVGLLPYQIVASGIDACEKYVLGISNLRKRIARASKRKKDLKLGKENQAHSYCSFVGF